MWLDLYIYICIYIDIDIARAQKFVFFPPQLEAHA